jgi:hypothetical protein
MSALRYQVPRRRHINVSIMSPEILLNDFRMALWYRSYVSNTCKVIRYDTLPLSLLSATLYEYLIAT